MIHTKRAALLLVGLTLGFSGLPAGASESPGRIQCKVTHSISCAEDACQKVPEDSVYINLVLEVPGGDGNLCTATYCRSISWLDLMRGTGPQTFGAVRSSASGSTQDKQDQPVVDFYLWVAPDRKAFSLIPIDGYGSTWAGECRTSPRGEDPPLTNGHRKSNPTPVGSF